MDRLNARITTKDECSRDILDESTYAIIYSYLQQLLTYFKDKNVSLHKNNINNFPLLSNGKDTFQCITNACKRQMENLLELFNVCEFEQNISSVEICNWDHVPSREIIAETIVNNLIMHYIVKRINWIEDNIAKDLNIITSLQYFHKSLQAKDHIVQQLLNKTAGTIDSLSDIQNIITIDLLNFSNDTNNHPSLDNTWQILHHLQQITIKYRIDSGCRHLQVIESCLASLELNILSMKERICLGTSQEHVLNAKVKTLESKTQELEDLLHKSNKKISQLHRWKDQIKFNVKIIESELRHSRKQNEILQQKVVDCLKRNEDIRSLANAELESKNRQIALLQIRWNYANQRMRTKSGTVVRYYTRLKTDNFIQRQKTLCNMAIENIIHHQTRTYTYKKTLVGLGNNTIVQKSTAFAKYRPLLRRLRISSLQRQELQAHTIAPPANNNEDKTEHKTIVIPIPLFNFYMVFTYLALASRRYLINALVVQEQLKDEALIDYEGLVENLQKRQLIQGQFIQQILYDFECRIISMFNKIAVDLDAIEVRLQHMTLNIAEKPKWRLKEFESAKPLETSNATIISNDLHKSLPHNLDQIIFVNPECCRYALRNSCVNSKFGSQYKGYHGLSDRHSKQRLNSYGHYIMAGRWMLMAIKLQKQHIKRKFISTLLISASKFHSQTRKMDYMYNPKRSTERKRMAPARESSHSENFSFNSLQQEIMTYAVYPDTLTSIQNSLRMLNELYDYNTLQGCASCAQLKNFMTVCDAINKKMQSLSTT